MSAPKRVRRSRAAGARMPADAVYVGRPGKWGNPWAVGDKKLDGEIMAAPEAVEKYRFWVTSQIEAGTLDVEELRGRDLACWCVLGAPCHADVLLSLANATPPRFAKRVLAGGKR